MMKNILICPDSFKGTFSNKEVSLIIKETLLSLNPSLNITTLPIADGGEGSIEAINERKPIKKIKIKCHGPNKQIIDTYYGEIDQDTAIIESALIIGLSLAFKRTPLLTTSYGLGEAILDAINKGYKTIYLTLGGSSTNDGGVGLLSALGVKFFNKNGKAFIPTSTTLIDIVSINASKLKELIKDINFITLVDVNNPLTGVRGATYTFAKQKGAKENELEILEKNMVHYQEVINKEYQVDLKDIPGLGAAGGLGAAAYFFLKSQMLPGIETILSLLDFDHLLVNNDIVISGEGKVDSQSLDGKVISGVITHNKKFHKPLYLITGINELKEIDPSIKGIYETNIHHLPFDEVKDRTKELLIEAIKRLYKDLNL